MIEVLFITYWYPHSSDPTEARFIQDHVRAVGKYCSVIVLTVDPTLPFMDTKVQRDGMILEVRVGLPRWPRPLRALLSYFCFLRGFWLITRSLKTVPDVINGTILPAAFFSVTVGRLSKIPVVITEHSSTVGKMSLGPLEKALARLTYESADTVVSVSHVLDAAIARLAPKAKRTVIGNAVNEASLSSVPRQHAVASESRLLFVGRLVPEKGLMDLLRALLLLRKESGTVIGLDVIGSGPAAEPARRFVDENQLQHVQFHGALPHAEVIEWIHRAKAVVIPSHYETFSVVAVEALACCVPVIGSSVGVIPELAKAGLVRMFSPGDIRELAEAIRSLDTEPLHVDERGRAHVIEQFGYTRIGGEYCRLYTRLLRHR